MDICKKEKKRKQKTTGRNQKSSEFKSIFFNIFTVLHVLKQLSVKCLSQLGMNVSLLVLVFLMYLCIIFRIIWRGKKFYLH